MTQSLEQSEVSLSSLTDNKLNDLICLLGEEKLVPVTISKSQDDTNSQLPDFNEETIEEQEILPLESNPLTASDRHDVAAYADISEEQEIFPVVSNNLPVSDLDLEDVAAYAEITEEQEMFSVDDSNNQIYTNTELHEAINSILVENQTSGTSSRELETPTGFPDIPIPMEKRTENGTPKRKTSVTEIFGSPDVPSTVPERLLQSRSIMKPVSIKSAACDIKVSLEVGLATSVPSKSSSRLEEIIGVPVIQSSPVAPQNTSNSEKCQLKTVLQTNISVDPMVDAAIDILDRNGNNLDICTPMNKRAQSKNTSILSPGMDQQAPVQSGQSQVSLSSVAAGQPYLTSPEVNHQTITGVPPSHPSSDVLDLEANLTPSIQAVRSSNGQAMVPLEPDGDVNMNIDSGVQPSGVAVIRPAQHIEIVPGGTSNVTIEEHQLAQFPVTDMDEGNSGSSNNSTTVQCIKSLENVLGPPVRQSTPVISRVKRGLSKVAASNKKGKAEKSDKLKPNLTVTFKRSNDAIRSAVMYIKSTEKLKNQEPDKNPMLPEVQPESIMEKKKKKEVMKNYTSEEIQDAILIYFSSPKTYKLLRRKKMIKRLPHPRTILRHIEGYKCAPGQCCS